MGCKYSGLPAVERQPASTSTKAPSIRLTKCYMVIYDAYEAATTITTRYMFNCW
jgi:hypothetical protein